MGSGRTVRADAARLGLRLHPGEADRARILAAALGWAGRSGVARGELKRRFTLLFLALSTSARDGPACPSSGGEGRRCCLLPPPAPIVSPARRQRCRGGAPRT